MSQRSPLEIKSDSPDEVVFLLYSLISSPLCMHTKDWICYLYLRSRPWVDGELGVMTSHFKEGRPFIKYRNREEPAPLNLAELLSHILDLNKPSSRIFCVEQVRAWKLTNTTWATTLPSLCNSINIRMEGFFNPAVWFALWGRYTAADFVNNRPLAKFIDLHWNRLMTQCDQISLGKYWQLNCHSDGRNRCRCPGHELASHLAPKWLPGWPPSFASFCDNDAEAVIREITSHIDPWIIQFVKPGHRRSERIRSTLSGNSGEGWHTPNSPPGRWTYVSYFKPLAALADDIVESFESLKNDPKVMFMAKVRWFEERDILANEIEKQRRISLEMGNSVLDNDFSLRVKY